MNFPIQNRLPESGFVRPPTHLALYRRLATVFIVMTLLVGGLVFYVVWSKATVIVLSRQEEVRAEFIADIAGQPGGDELAGTVRSLTDSLTRTFPTVTVAPASTEDKTEGRVRITSRLATPQTLIATTRLLTPDGKLFRIRDQVIVPAGGSVEADVYADAAGPGNDIGDSTFTIPGLPAALQEQFDVETAAPIAAGLRNVRVVTAADVETAVAQLKAELTKSLGTRLRTEAQAAGSPVSGEVIEATVLSQRADPAVGAEAEEFSVTVTARADGVFFDRDQMDRLAERRVTEIVPFGRRLSRLEPSATSHTIEKVDLPAGRANLRVTALGNAVLSGDYPALDPAKLAGVTEAAAVTYLEQISGVASASVKISPFWSGRLPTSANNIKLEVR